MNTDIHRLLDEAFTGIDMTPDAQDLKEEIRANLVARVDELEATGVSPTDAAHRAIAELGDVQALVAGAGADAPARAGHAAIAARHRVRPKPAFVVRTVLLSLVGVAALALLVVGGLGHLGIGLAGMFAFGLVFAAALGFVTADALMQETTTNHPLPAPRAIGFGLATGALLAALALGGTFAAHLDQVWLVVVATLLFVASIALFSWLGATTTNRHKAWMRELMADESPNRFEREPEAAARFGIYTVAIWVIGGAAVAILVITVGWWWAPVAVAVIFALWMFVLARMLFAPDKNRR